MSEDILNRLQNIEIKSAVLIDSLINEPRTDADYLIENYIIANKRRYLNELNESLSSNIIDTYGHDFLTKIYHNTHANRIKECKSTISSFGSRNVLAQANSSSEDGLNPKFKKFVQIKDFLEYNKENSNVQLKKPSSNTSLDLFNKNSTHVQNYFKKIQQKNSNNEAPSNFQPKSSNLASNLNNNFINTTSCNNTNSNNYSSANEQSNSSIQPVNKYPLTKSTSLNTNSYSNNNNNNNSNNSNNNTNNLGYGINYNNNCNNNNYSNNGASSLNNQNKFSSIKYEPRVTKCYKRKNEDDPHEDYDNVDSSLISNFKSAKEQLAIENAKQGNNSSGQQMQQQPSLAKRPMGNMPKRSVYSKFNCPIPRAENEEQPMQNNYNMQMKNNNNNNNNNNNGNNTEQNLNPNIEQKLVDVIMSEVMDKTPAITWDDIAGLEFVKKTIKEIVIWPMLRPDIFNGLRGPPKGLLLFGPPGTGKTLIAKCIANESKSTFFNISSSTLTSKWQGESEKLVKVLFEIARAHQPAVIFVDEIDSLLAQRSDDDRESSRRLKTEFFVQMDGAKTSGDERILMIGATNRPQELDDAARRRFVKKLYIPLPEFDGRKQIIVNLLRKQATNCHLDDDDVNKIAEITDGYSGADMTNLCREAALGPIRSIEMSSIEHISVEQVRPINFQDFIDAMTQVRASVSQDDLDQYYKWNNSFGSVAILNK